MRKPVEQSFSEMVKSNNGMTFKYFAIASMMNPTSLKNRNIQPTSSRPAKILDFRLGYFGSLGMAEAIPQKGASFHGVVHELTEGEMKHLDAIEVLYIKSPARVRYYDGTEDSVFVYTKSSEDMNDMQEGVPHKRYIDLMIEGALHHGVDREYIESLGKTESVPRPVPSKFRSFGPPPSSSVKMTLDEVLRYDGEDGRPLYITVNGKILHMVSATAEIMSFLQSMMKKFQSPALEDFLPKIIYDPYYGLPRNLEDCTREHSAYVEHLWLTSWGVDGAVVGSIEQRYRD